MELVVVVLPLLYEQAHGPAGGANPLALLPPYALPHLLHEFVDIALGVVYFEIDAPDNLCGLLLHPAGGALTTDHMLGLRLLEPLFEFLHLRIQALKVTIHGRVCPVVYVLFQGRMELLHFVRELLQAVFGLLRLLEVLLDVRQQLHQVQEVQ